MRSWLVTTFIQHKIAFTLITVTALGGGYYGYKKLTTTTQTTKYILAAVTKGTVTATVSGSGQISASNQVDLKAKTSGDVVKIAVKSGQTVKAGDTILTLDSEDAAKAVRDAKSNLAAANLSLQKLTKPADELSLTQAENQLVQAKISQTKAADNLAKSYEEGLTTVSTAFLDLPGMMTELKDIVSSSFLSADSSGVTIDYYIEATKKYDDKILGFKEASLKAYEVARQAYGSNFTDYKTTGRFSQPETIEALINETYATTKKVTDVLKNTIVLIRFYEDKLIAKNLQPTTIADRQLTDLNNFSTKMNTDLSSLLAGSRAIQAAKDSQKKADDDNAQSYEDGFNTITNTFLDLPGVITSLNEILFSTNLSTNGNQSNIDYFASADTNNPRSIEYRDGSNASYQTARSAYNTNLDNYNDTKRSSDQKTIAVLIDHTYETTKLVTEAIKQATNLINFYKDAVSNQNVKPNPQADTYLATLNSYTAKMTSHLSALVSAQKAIQTAQDSQTKAVDDLQKSYDDGATTVTNTFLDLPAIMASLQEILADKNSQTITDDYSKALQTYQTKTATTQDDIAKTYKAATLAYAKSFNTYKNSSRTSSPKEIKILLEQTHESSQSLAESIKKTTNLLQVYKDIFTKQNLKPSSTADIYLTDLNTYLGKINTIGQNLVTARRNIQTSLDDITTGGFTVEEKNQSLLKLQAGADNLDIASQKLTIEERQNALQDALETLQDSIIVAPFASQIAKIDVKKGDSISANTVVATIVTDQHLAEISLNEVDVAKIKPGQKATLTFDAIPDLTLTGQVAEVDTIGTVSQGVVSYIVKITFDLEDERIKPGMSVSANIITDLKTDVLFVGNSAIKSQNGSQYVEMPRSSIDIASLTQTAISLPESPRRQTVETGLANDEITEIKSGLNEGDVVITSTVTTQTTTTTSQNSSLRIPGLGGGGGGGFRAGGGR